MTTPPPTIASNPSCDNESVLLEFWDSPLLPVCTEGVAKRFFTKPMKVNRITGFQALCLVSLISHLSQKGVGLSGGEDSSLDRAAQTLMIDMKDTFRELDIERMLLSNKVKLDISVDTYLALSPRLLCGIAGVIVNSTRILNFASEKTGIEKRSILEAILPPDEKVLKGLASEEILDLVTALEESLPQEERSQE